jgi:hypothetical protein
MQPVSSACESAEEMLSESLRPPIGDGIVEEVVSEESK